MSTKEVSENQLIVNDNNNVVNNDNLNLTFSYDTSVINDSVWSDQQLEEFVATKGGNKDVEMAVNQILLRNFIIYDLEEIKKKYEGEKRVNNMRLEKAYYEIKGLVKSNSELSDILKECNSKRQQASKDLEDAKKEIQLLKDKMLQLELNAVNRDRSNFMNEEGLESERQSSSHSVSSKPSKTGSNIPESDIKELKQLLEDKGPVAFSNKLKSIFNVYEVIDEKRKVEWVKLRIINGTTYVDSIEDDTNWDQLIKILEINDDTVGRRKTYYQEILRAAKSIRVNGIGLRNYTKLFEQHYRIAFGSFTVGNIIEQFKMLLLPELLEGIKELVTVESIEAWVEGALKHANKLEEDLKHREQRENISYKHINKPQTSFNFCVNKIIR